MLNATFDEWQQDFQHRLEVDQSLIVQAVMVANEDRRQRELDALARLLKAEMDRQALETDQSLRYVVAHQLKEQERMDQLVRHVQLFTEGSGVTDDAPVTQGIASEGACLGCSLRDSGVQRTLEGSEEAADGAATERPASTSPQMERKILLSLSPH